MILVSFQCVLELDILITCSNRTIQLELLRRHGECGPPEACTLLDLYPMCPRVFQFALDHILWHQRRGLCLQRGRDRLRPRRVKVMPQSRKQTWCSKSPVSNVSIYHFHAPWPQPIPTSLEAKSPALMPEDMIQRELETPWRRSSSSCIVRLEQVMRMSKDVTHLSIKMRRWHIETIRGSFLAPSPHFDGQVSNVLRHSHYLF
jgi:hypothetical protein